MWRVQVFITKYTYIISIRILYTFVTYIKLEKIVMKLQFYIFTSCAQNFIFSPLSIYVDYTITLANTMKIMYSKRFTNGKAIYTTNKGKISIDFLEMEFI